MGLDVLNPASPQARDLLRLWKECLWICAFLLFVVTASIVWIVIRFRRRDGREPPQTTGNLRLEVLWTAGPILLVSALFVLSVVAAEAVDAPMHRDPDIVVTGHQWWWEVRYPNPGVITANEVHVPVGRDVLIAVDSADVIHDFWAPRLGRKIDAFPGYRNFIRIRAEQAGVYNGFCAEFCGAQHAWMRFRVVAEAPAAYAQWLAAQAAPALPAYGGEALVGEMRFKQLTCVNCHNISGINSQKPFAPDLTHLAGRRMLAGELLKNTPENLRNWLHQPNILKPDCYMPNLNLSDADLTSVTAFLETLK